MQKKRISRKKIKRISRVKEEPGGETKNKSIKSRKKNVLAKYRNRTTYKKRKSIQMDV